MKYYILIASLCAAVIIGGCGGGQDKASANGKTAAVVVKTQPVEQSDFPVTLRLGGNLRGDRQTTIPARVQTTVTRIPVRTGQQVRKDDMLVVLDSGGVQSQYRQAEAVFLNAEKQYKKMKSLFESGAISETQLDGAETQYKVARADFDATRQSIQITAPFDGVVSDIYVRVGDEVSPGTPVVEIANVGSLRLYLEVPGSQLGDIRTGQMVTVKAPTDSTVIMSGKVISIADAADKNTRSFEVECEFQSPPPAFAPGMYVIAAVETMSLPNALLIPNDAIIYRTGQALVYLVSGDTAALVPVTVTAPGEGKSAVTGQLAAGQKVVVVGQKNLTPGTPVREAAI